MQKEEPKAGRGNALCKQAEPKDSQRDEDMKDQVSVH